jgi:hypothetical protein
MSNVAMSARHLYGTVDHFALCEDLSDGFIGVFPTFENDYQEMSAPCSSKDYEGDVEHVLRNRFI